MNSNNEPGSRMTQEEADQHMRNIYEGLSLDLVNQAMKSNSCVGLDEGDHGMNEKDLREIARRCKALGASAQLFREKQLYTLLIGPPQPAKQSSGSSSSSV